MKDYYQILGISNEATDEEIKKAYRKLAKEWHPDLHPGDAEAEERFKEVNEAYEILSNPQKRQEYDNPNPFSNIFDAFNPFGGFRRGPQPNPNAPKKGKDVRIPFTISLGESLFGVRKTAKYNYQGKCDECEGAGGEGVSNCDRCQGRGWVGTTRQEGNVTIRQNSTCPTCQGRGTYVKTPCDKCNGTGASLKEKKVEFEIPAGIKHGQRMQIHGAGLEGINGGPPGGLLVDILVEYPQDLSQEDEKKLREILWPQEENTE